MDADRLPVPAGSRVIDVLVLVLGIALVVLAGFLAGVFYAGTRSADWERVLKFCVLCGKPLVVRHEQRGFDPETGQPCMVSRWVCTQLDHDDPYDRGELVR